MNLTVLIPTNKDDFIPRLEKHYSFVDVNLVIVNAPERSVIDIFQNTKIETDYVVFGGDDDLYSPEGLKMAVGFLERNPHFIACHGRGLYVTEKASSPMPFGEILEDTPEERLENFLKNYFVNLFSIHRREVWEKMFPFSKGLPCFTAELFPCCISAVMGRTWSLNIPYLYRELHDKRIKHPDLKDLIQTKEWKDSYQIFRDYFESYDIDNLFQPYLKKCLNKKKPSKLSNFISRLRR